MTDHDESRLKTPTADLSLLDAVARYEAVLASTLDPLVTIDGRGVIQTASDSVRQVFGWGPEELVGRNISVLMPEPHRDKHDAYLADYQRTGVTNILGRPRQFEAVRRDGTKFPIELAVSRVNIPGRAEPLFTGILRDVTDRHRAEQQIRLLKELAVGIATAHDLETGLTTTLERICVATGWEYGEAWVPAADQETLVDTPVWHMTDPRLQLFQEATQGTTFRRGEGLIGRVWESREPEWLTDLHRDLLFHRAEVASKSGLRTGVAVPILEQNEVVAVLAFFMTTDHDEDRRMLDLVTAAVAPLGGVFQRRWMEQELEQHRQDLEVLVSERTAELEATHEQLRLADRLASIGTLAAGLGHDMNNVLLPVRMRLDAFDAADLPDTLREHLGAIRGSVDYLQKLTDGLHLLARDPDRPTTNEQTNINEWWTQVNSLLVTAVPSHATLEHDLRAGLPPVAVAPHQLTQAVLNLVVNSAEAISDDGTIRIWAEPFDDGRFVQLAVSDDGHGMTAEIKHRALDPFFTSKRRGLGTGLGLSLVHGVAKSAGGSVRIDSEPGAGTTVLLTLAVAGYHDDAPLTSPAMDTVITVRDERLGSLVEACLANHAVETRHSDTPPAPNEAAIWVTEPNPEHLDAARRFLAANDRHRVILLGSPDADWRLQGVVTVEHPDDFELLRERIGEAVDAR